MCRSAIPWLKNSDHAHILNLSPPLNMNPKWFAQHLAYTMSKYGMSMIVLGLAEELKKDRIAANALWPRTTIATAAVQNLLGGDFLKQKITLKHGAIKNIDMPAMTMVFRVKDARMLDALAEGDKVKFSAEKINGQFTVTSISK